MIRGPFVRGSGAGVQGEVHRRRATTAVAVTVASVLCFVLAACATVVAGTSPVPPPREPDRIEPNTYSQPVSAADKVALELAERLRRLDPCALMPEAVVGKYGELRRFGPEKGFDTCTAVVRRPGDRQRDLSITLDLSAPPRGEEDRAVRFGGAEIERLRVVGDSTAECTRWFALDLPVTAFVDGDPPVRTAAVHVVEHFRPGVVPETGTACEAADETHDVAVDGLRALPARPTRGPGRIRLAAADPCEVVGLFAPENLIQWSVDADPYRCDYSVLLPGGGAQTWSVRFGLEPEGAPVAGPDREGTSVAGRSIVLRRDGDLCTAATPVEDVVDTNRVAARTGGRTVPTVAVSSAGTDCSRLAPLVVELADLALT